MKDELTHSIRAQRQKQEQDLAELSERLETLRVQYDRYFMGLDKIPPERMRSALERDFRNTPLQKSHNTALKFRFNSVRSRLATEARRWDRIMRLIEEGKFKRDRNALGSMHKATGGRGKQDEAPKGDGMRDLYDNWLAARAQTGQSTGIEYDKFKRKIEAQRKSQMDKYGWSKVDYRVRVKDGKVTMVAKGKKDEDAS